MSALWYWYIAVGSLMLICVGGLLFEMLKLDN